MFAVYAVVQMLSSVQLTPGGVGVTEALYSAALALVAEGIQQGLLVASVLVFRVVTYPGRRLRRPRVPYRLLRR